jgi:protein-L-isoaspartate(D-aspartate) O-methyltransferase
MGTSSEQWQQMLGARLAAATSRGNRESLEIAVVAAYEAGLAPKDRDRLMRHRGELASACRVDVVPVTVFESTLNLRYLIRRLTGEPEPETWPVVPIRWFEQVELEIDSGRFIRNAGIAECRLLPSGQPCQLVFAGADDQAYLIVATNEQPRRLATGPRVTELYRAQYQGDDAVGQAMSSVRRADFMTLETRDLAPLDRAVPIGHGQTISQPSAVAWILRLADIRPGNRVEEVGSGCGYVLALASRLAGKRGSVVGCEVVQELLDASRTYISPYQEAPVTLVKSTPGLVLGAPELGPFDRIVVSASAERPPLELVEQLANGGRLVMPVGTTLAVITKTRTGVVQEQYLTEPGVGFVPLV